MLGLRTSDGVDARALREDFGARVVDEVFAVLETYPPGLVTATVRRGGGGGEGVGEGENEVFDLGAKGWRDAFEAGMETATIALTDPEGFLVSTEVISTLLARVPSLRDA